MKVMCINDENMGAPISVKVGCVYEVSCYDDTTYKLPVYWLKEIPGQPYSYWRFAPLSDIDETEMVRNLQTETALTEK